MMELVSAKVEVTVTRRKQLGDDWTLAGDTIRLPAAGPGTQSSEEYSDSLDPAPTLVYLCK